MNGVRESWPLRGAAGRGSRPGAEGQHGTAWAAEHWRALPGRACGLISLGASSSAYIVELDMPPVDWFFDRYQIQMAELI